MTDWFFLFFTLVGVFCTVSVAMAAVRAAVARFAAWWMARPYQPALERIAACLEAAA